MTSPKKKRKRKEDQKPKGDDLQDIVSVVAESGVVVEEQEDIGYGRLLSPLKKIRDIFWTKKTPSKDEQVLILITFLWKVVFTFLGFLFDANQKIKE